MTLIEAAVDTLDSALAAVRDGAGRLELCADLARGGTTPSAGLIRVLRLRVEQPLLVMIRPRPGNFVHDEAELEVMLADIAEACRAGADGVVFGVLTAGREINRGATARLIEAARPLSVTFHRAVDDTRDPIAALEILRDLGVDRVLTAGGADSAEAGLDGLRGMMRVGPSPIVLPGGGIRAGNVARIVRALGVAEVHVGAPGTAEPGRIAAVAAALAQL